jgi:radical SAM superfamily enzyme YgiQ (UPF0313 family)
MKVIFVSFQENSDIIGVKYLHAYIISKGYDSSIMLIPNTKTNNIRAAIDYIIQCRPDVLGFSAMSYEFRRARDFANLLRTKLTTVPFFFGGIHATADPESCLTVSDIVVRGEGEETLLELLRILDGSKSGKITQVAGISFRENDRVVNNTVRQPIQNLDALPYPRHLPEYMYVVHQGEILSIKKPVMYRKYGRYRGVFLSVLSSRGCPFSCHYCSNSMLRSLYGKNNLRSRSARFVIDEIINEIHDFGNILYVNFQDDCFMMHPKCCTSLLNLVY